MRRVLPGNTRMAEVPVFGPDPKSSAAARAITFMSTPALTGLDQRDRRTSAVGWFTGRTGPLQVFAGVASVGNALNRRPDRQTTTTSVSSALPSVVDQLEALRQAYGDRLGRFPGDAVR